MSAPTWTKEQREAVTSPKRALLVSAAAGSGKTSVLADRCVWLVCDAPEPCDVDRLLVVTFTRAAAGEMRDRINKKLRERADQSNDPRIEQQLRILDRATISTLDSFCATLLREHFVAANVDPNFVILDEDEGRLLRLEAGMAAIDSFFKSDREDELHRLLRIHFNSDDAQLIASISHIHNVLTSVVDPQAWLDRQLARLDDSNAIDEAVAEFYKPLDALLERLSKEGRKVGALAQTNPTFAKYAQLAFELADFAEQVQALIKDGNLNKALAIAPPTADFKKGKRPDDPALKERIDKLLTPLRESVGPKGELGKLLAHTPADLKASVLEIAPRLRLFIDLVRTFQSNYTAAKRAVRSLDFADVARAALTLLQSPDDPNQPSQLARALHDRFQHVLVDECQDINPIQDAILRLVSTEAHSKRNVECVSNLFSVGDVKQSIYGFRLANPAQFIARSDELDIVGKAEPDRGALILLRENFRSRGQLLDAVNEIFVRLMTRDSAGIDYDDTHKLREGRAHGIAPGGFTGKPIELHVIDDDSTDHDDDSHDAESDLGASETEAQLIAHRIHRLMGWIGDKPALVLDETDPTLQAHRPIELGDIAILLRSARGTAGALASHLRRRGVPVHVENASGFFEAIEVLDMLSLLRVADNSTRDIPLAALIRSPFSGVSQPESLMARIRLATPDVPFHEAIRGQKDSTSLRDFFNQIEEWRSILRDERLDRAIERIVEETGYMNWLSGLPDGAQRIANVQELVRRARTFAAFERQGVSRFVQFLTELEQEQDLDLPAAASQSRDVVRIMTVHKSKGLEFPVVIVPNLGRKRNRLSLAAPVLIDREAGLGIHAYEAERHVRYPSLFHRLVARAHDQREVAEELRILYVALTRAREHLILIGTGKKTEQWREDWADHTGPLPAEKIRSAQTMLDRLGPVAEMIHRDAPGNIEITRYSLGEIASLQPALIDTDLPSALSNLARFEPIEPAPTIPKDLQDSFDRINQRYPFEMLTAVSSANAVTDFKKPTARARLTHLARPHFTLDTSKLNAADRGTATHAAFQHLDYHKLANADEIRAQLAKLLDRQILRESEVAAIDIESLLWFAQTELCRSMIAPNVRLLRELPVYMAMPTGVADSPMDQLLLRGRIDAVMIEPDGTATVIDFKSDRLNEADVDARAEQYRSQLALYRQAMTRMSGREARAKLVFLGAKQVIDV